MVYTLISLIGPEIFDFNRFDKNLDAKAFLNDNSILPCDCTGFLFVAKDDNHITAVDLRVVVSNALFKHFSLKVQSTVKTELLIIKKLIKAKEKLRKHGVYTSSYSEWKEAVKSPINEKISHISSKATTEKSKITLILKNEILTEESKMLYNKFVVFPIDKYGGNVGGN